MTTDVNRRSETIALLRRMEESGALTPTSLCLAQRPDLTVEQCEAIARFLGLLHDGSKWWMADLILESEARFGELAYQVAAATGRSERTIGNWVWVASRVPRSRRRENLKFSHHLAVAGLELDEQSIWLDKAEREGWSSHQLAAAIRTDSHGAVKDCDIKYERAVGRLRDLVHECYGAEVDVEVRLVETDPAQVELDYYRAVLARPVE